uniref:Uncharacterized protein n=1 Tax=Solanum lycopersicum TaxID=4081 RepID=A0A3Q7G3G9_SOLLC
VEREGLIQWMEVLLSSIVFQKMLALAFLKKICPQIKFL